MHSRAKPAQITPTPIVDFVHTKRISCPICWHCECEAQLKRKVESERYTQKAGIPKKGTVHQKGTVHPKKGGILRMSIPEKEAVHLKKGWYSQKGRYA